MRKIILNYLLDHDTSKNPAYEDLVWLATDAQLNKAMDLIEMASSNGLIIEALTNE